MFEKKEKTFYDYHNLPKRMNNNQNHQVKQKNLKLNILFNGLYQLFVLIVPFITSPYISRVLLPEGVGAYSVGLSWVTYFSTLAAFGFLDYGTTMIAKHRENKEEKSRLFWEILLSKTAFTILVFTIYAVLVCNNVFFSSSYQANTKLVFLLLGSNIIVNAFDCSFLFQGEENFGQLCLRNFVVRLLNMILIFTLVKSSDDYVPYIAIMGGSNLLLGVLSAVGIHKLIVKPRLTNPHLLHHIIGASVYFIPVAAISFFPILSKTLISLFIEDTAQSGFYEQADKLTTLIITMINSVDAIMMSRMANLYANHETDQIQAKTKKTIQLYFLLALPAFFGLLIINPFFTVGFFGSEYSASVNIVYFLALKTLFAPLTALLCAIYYIPNNKIRYRNIFYLVGIVVDLVLNLIFIHFMGTIGAAIANTVTEFFLALLFVLFCKNDIPFFHIAKETFIKAFDGSLIMFIGCFFLTLLIENKISPIKASILIVVLGVVLYGGFLMLSREQVVIEYYSLYKNKVVAIFNRFKKKNK